MTKPTPHTLAKQAARILELVEGDENFIQDPAEMAAVLNTAAAACLQVHAANAAMVAMADILKPRG